MASSASKRWLARFVAWLGTVRAHLWVAVLGMLAVAPAITVGFSSDDHMQRIRSRPDPGVEGFTTAQLDYFSFAESDAQVRAFMDEGLFSWWTAPGFRLAFWRPLSSVTHAIDFALWPDSPELMYVHSILWYGLLLLVVGALYRRLVAPIGVGGFALLLYAIDDAHGPTVGFISNRNALIMATFVVAALWVHDRVRRDGWRPGRWLSPMLMGLALLAGEGAIAGFGYLFAHAVCLEPGRLHRRVRVLVPYVLVGLAWAVAYKLQGFGAHGSGIYFEPTRETAAYLKAAVVRVPVLLGAQLVGPWSDLWLAWPPRVARAVFVFVLAAIVMVTATAWSRLRRDPVARMWGLGTVLACVPIAGTFPADRLLILVGLGAAPLLAWVVVDAFEAGAATWRRLVAFGLILVHLVIAPLLLPIRARSMTTVNTTLGYIDRAVPKTPDIATNTLVVVNAPNDGLVSYLPVFRASRHEPRPARLRLLATSMEPIEVTRLDAHTLRIRPDNGFLATIGERMLRGPDHPFSPGDTIELPDLTVTVETITVDARPATVTFRFADPLDAEPYLLLSWQGADFEPWTPPPPGQTETIPAVDTEAMLRDVLQR